MSSKCTWKMLAAEKKASRVKMKTFTPSEHRGYISALVNKLVPYAWHSSDALDMWKF
jgi:hypothetical protein